MQFSVIIPSYNRADLITKTIESVLNQSFKDYELIVVNDGSTDNTLEVLSPYKNKIILIDKENSGAEKSRNAGAEKASGNYLCFLDSDDLFFDWTLDVYNTIIVKQKHPPLIIGQPLHFTSDTSGNFFGKSKDEIAYMVYRDYFSKDRTVYSSSSMIVIRRDIFFELGGFRKNYIRKEFYLDDIEFMQRAGTVSPVVIVYSPFQFAYRTHPENSVKNLKRVLKSLNQLLYLDKQNLFAGGAERKSDRQAIIGGPVYYWLLKALRHGIIKDSLLLLGKAYPYIIKGLLKKIKTTFGKKKELITITFDKN